jgi:hypothetical protein
MKKVMLIILLLCFALIAAACSAGQKNVADTAMTYEIVKQTYTDKKVMINYPQVTKMSDSKKLETINEIIKTEALDVVSGYANLDNVIIEIDYEVTWKSVELLSIKYWGYRNIIGTPHPTKEFYTTNINMHEGSRLRLKDLVNIDDGFIEKVKKGKLHAVSPQITLEMVSRSNNMTIKGFNKADVRDYQENIQGVFSHFTNDSLGISLHVSHPIGDHVEFEVKYQDIVDNIKAENKIWKSIFK